MLGLQVACGSGLERIYRFLQSDEPSNRLGLDFESMKVGLLRSASRRRISSLQLS